VREEEESKKRVMLKVDRVVRGNVSKGRVIPTHRGRPTMPAGVRRGE